MAKKIKTADNMVLQDAGLKEISSRSFGIENTRKKLYNNLYNQGNKSEIEALKAGAKIEDIDIYDLLRLKKQTENQEIIKIYNFLECGSRNHFRAFTKGLNKNGALLTKPNLFLRKITKRF